MVRSPAETSRTNAGCNLPPRYAGLISYIANLLSPSSRPVYTLTVPSAPVGVTLALWGSHPAARGPANLRDLWPKGPPPNRRSFSDFLPKENAASNVAAAKNGIG